MYLHVTVRERERERQRERERERERENKSIPGLHIYMGWTSPSSMLSRGSLSGANS